jgi:drug/metabolite transporter (DMT)-like permease
MGEGSGRGRDPLRWFLLAAAGSALLAGNPVVGKYCLRGEGGFNVLTFAFLWMALASGYTFGLLAGQRNLRRFAVPRREVPFLVLIGLMTGAVQALGWLALVYLNPAFASFLQRFVPVLTIVAGVLVLGERLRGFELAAIGMMMGGGVLSTAAEWEAVAVGVGLAMASYVIVSAQRLIIKLSVRRVDPMVVNFWRTTGGAVSLGLLAGLTGQMKFGVEGARWAVLLLGAFLGPCLGVFLLVASYRRWELSRSTLVMMAQPLITFPLAYVALGTVPSRWQLAGGLVILAGAFWLVWVHSRRHGLHSGRDSVSSGDV